MGALQQNMSNMSLATPNPALFSTVDSVDRVSPAAASQARLQRRIQQDVHTQDLKTIPRVLCTGQEGIENWENDIKTTKNRFSMKSCKKQNRHFKSEVSRIIHRKKLEVICNHISCHWDEMEEVQSLIYNFNILQLNCHV